MTAFITCPGKLETDEACRSAAPGVHLPVGVASENEPVVLLLRHAVGTPEVAAVRHREPEIGQWPVSNIGHADGGPLGWQRVQLIVGYGALASQVKLSCTLRTSAEPFRPFRSSAVSLPKKSTSTEVSRPAEKERAAPDTISARIARSCPSSAPTWRSSNHISWVWALSFSGRCSCTWTIGPSRSTESVFTTA